MASSIFLSVLLFFVALLSSLIVFVFRFTLHFVCDVVFLFFCSVWMLSLLPFYVILGFARGFGFRAAYPSIAVLWLFYPLVPLLQFCSFSTYFCLLHISTSRSHRRLARLRFLGVKDLALQTLEDAGACWEQGSKA